MAFDPEPDATDLGYEHWMKVVRVGQEPAGGLCVWHRCAKAGGEWQPSVIYLKPGIGNTHWTVEQVEPLTLSPSLRFMCCGDHGWIQNGRWVPAG